MAAAVALLSGGLDSGVAAALWCERGGTLALCLTADYGQRAVVAEHRAAQALAARWRVPWRSFELPWLRDAAATAGSALVRTDIALPIGTRSRPGDAESATAVWVPARNVVLLAAGAAFAEALRASTVLVGFNREEAATFADNREEFAVAFSGALAFGTRNAVRVESPTAGLDKRAIVAAARRLGLCASDFWSCYGGGTTPCGRCESCSRSERAWAAGGGSGDG